MLHPNYIPQVLQVPEAQLAQELPPIEEVSPLSSLEKEQKLESTRSAVFPHLGQTAPSFDWLNRLNNSNLVLQPGHTYSYIGIFFPLYPV